MTLPVNRADRIVELVESCLFTADEVRRHEQDDAIVITGVTFQFVFHPDRVRGVREELEELVRVIVKDEFFEEGGGGWSISQLCEARDGTLWTGMHGTVEGFVCLSIAAGLAHYCAPRSAWAKLPGGLPYVVFRKPAERGPSN